MSDADIRKMLDDVYDDSREVSFRSMLRDFYSRRMLSVVLMVWALGLAFMAVASYSAVQFFGTDQTRDQILYATLFICALQFLGLMKIFAWQLIHRNSITREIKRLEIRVAELAKALDKAAPRDSH